MREMDPIRDLDARSCPACRHLEMRMEDYFAGLQGLLSRSGEARGDYAGEGGLCPLHTWQLAQFASPRGIARGHATFMRTLADRLACLIATRAPGEPFPVLRNGPDECRVCRFLKAEEAATIGAFHVFLERDEHLERYERSQGLCLRHLSQLLDRPLDEARKARLLFHAAERLREIGESMTQYDRKLEERKRDQLTRDEKDAYRRGIVMLAGERTVVSPFMKGN